MRRKIDNQHEVDTARYGLAHPALAGPGAALVEIRGISATAEGKLLFINWQR